MRSRRSIEVAAYVRPAYKFDESSQGTVPEAITGGIAEAFYMTEKQFRTYSGIPEDLQSFMSDKINTDMWGVIKKFYRDGRREKIMDFINVHRKKS